MTLKELLTRLDERDNKDVASSLKNFLTNVATPLTTNEVANFQAAGPFQKTHHMCKVKGKKEEFKTFVKAQNEIITRCIALETSEHFGTDVRHAYNLEPITLETEV